MASKTPEQIEREIERTRAEMTRTVAELEGRLSPGALMDYTTSYLKDSARGQAMVDGLAGSIARNPLPLAIMAFGAAWLILGTTRGRRRGAPEADVLLGRGRNRQSAREAARVFEEQGSAPSAREAARVFEGAGMAEGGMATGAASDRPRRVTITPAPGI